MARTLDILRLGRLRKRITWKIPPPDQDSAGGTTFVNSATDFSLWGDLATVWCEISTLRGRELPEGNTEVSETYLNVRQRWSKTTVPDSTMVGIQIVNGVTRAYQVKNVDDIDERRKTVDVMVALII